MAKRSDDYTKVKDYSYKFPLVGVASRNAKVQIRLHIEHGTFRLDLPTEVTALLKHPNGYVSSREMNEAIRMFDRQIEKYAAIIRTQDREKVIVINFKRNWPGRYAGGDLATHATPGAIDDLGGTFSRNIPILGMALDYEILWKIGDRGIFEIAFNDDGSPAGDPEFRYRIDTKDFKILPWSEEREAFFLAMRNGLGDMVERMNAFFAADFIANIDRAIEHGGNGLALTAPTKALPSPQEKCWECDAPITGMQRIDGEGRCRACNNAALDDDEGI